MPSASCRILFLVPVLLLFSLLPCQAAEGPPAEFRGIAFGALLSETQGLSPVAEIVSKNKKAYKDVYFRENEPLSFGKGTIRSVAYYFREDRLRSVVVAIEGDVNAFLVKDELIATYGEGRQIGNKYGWTWEEFSLVMERAPAGDMSVLTYTWEPRAEPGR